MINGGKIVWLVNGRKKEKKENEKERRNNKRMMLNDTHVRSLKHNYNDVTRSHGLDYKESFDN